MYPSSVLMNIMPAKVAGVKNIIMTTPCNSEGEVYATTLVAANEAGATAIYKAGGAQAIAALAYGTESIPKVDKIVGPEISSLHLQNVRYTDMSASIRSQVHPKSL